MTSNSTKLIFQFYKYICTGDSGPDYTGKPAKKPKDLAKIIYFYEKYAKFRREVRNDSSADWEFNFTIAGKNNMGMSRFLKWISPYLVNRIEVK